MKTTKCVNGSLNPRLLSLRENEIQLRIMGCDDTLDMSREIFADLEEKNECRLGKYSGRLLNKGSSYKREFVTVTIEDMNE